MCLLITSEEGKLPSEELLKKAARTNNDGWGIVTYKNGKPEALFGFTEEAMLEACKNAEGYPYMLHMRWATQGSKCLANNHPFEVAPDTWMAHNGIINIATPVDDRSDTWHFAEHVKGVLKEIDTDCAIKGSGIAADEWMRGENFVKTIEKWIGASNKVAFMLSDGAIVHANKSAGFVEDGIWYSNRNSHPYKFSTVGSRVGYHSFNDDFTECDWEGWMNRTHRDQHYTAGGALTVHGHSTKKADTAGPAKPAYSDLWLDIDRTEIALRSAQDNIDFYNTLKPGESLSEVDERILKEAIAEKDEISVELANYYYEAFGGDIDLTLGYLDGNRQIEKCVGGLQNLQDLMDQVLLLEYDEEEEEESAQTISLSDASIDVTTDGHVIMCPMEEEQALTAVQ